MSKFGMDTIGILVIVAVIFGIGVVSLASSALYHDSCDPVDYEYISGYVDNVYFFTGSTIIVIDGDEFRFVGEHRSIPVKEYVTIVFHKKHSNNMLPCESPLYTLDEWNIINLENEPN